MRLRRGATVASLVTSVTLSVLPCCKNAETVNGAAGRAAPAGPLPAALVMEYAMDGNQPGLTHGSSQLPERLARALAAKKEDYVPRTEHKRADGTPTFTNRLILETSPYLLQHAHNPVNWYAWGDAPFDRARMENKLVLLSVGYSTCHWCHVMERESFEDLEIATFMNENFVCIKVDREERPDIDDIYMAAVQMMTGRGGWPMTVVLTSDRNPVFGGTYFPPRDGARGARVGFLTILRSLHDEWRRDPGGLTGQGQFISMKIRKASEGAKPGDVPGPEAIRRGVSHLSATFDPTWGGFGRAPKFPRPITLELLARYRRRTKDAKALNMLVRTLEKMAAGGMYDHVGGGFHRYSTDHRWLVPHFEKMLYDQGQLVVAYLEGYQLTGNEDFARIVRETLDYVEREMTDEKGGFYSATDADSPGPNGESEEGLFFIWTPAEIDAAVGAERGRLVRAYYGVTERGNFEGSNILSTEQPLAQVAKKLGMESAALWKEIQVARKQLYEARLKRSPPLLDNKVLTSWNGLMISALARASHVLGDVGYVESAVRAADFLLTELRPNGRLRRSWNAGSIRHDAYLDDYAFLIQGLLDLYEATGNPRWLAESISLQGQLDEHFADETNGGYFFTGDEHEALLSRDKPDYDGAEPSGNSVAALNLLRLEQFTDKAAYRRTAERIFAANARALSGGVALPKMLSALDFYYDRPLQVVIVKANASENGGASLLQKLSHTFLPNRIISIGAEGNELEAQAKLMPLLDGKRALKGKTTAYVCRGNVCALPTSDPAVFSRQLSAVDPLP